MKVKINSGFDIEFDIEFTKWCGLFSDHRDRDRDMGNMGGGKFKDRLSFNLAIVCGMY